MYFNAKHWYFLDEPANKEQSITKPKEFLFLGLTDNSEGGFERMKKFVFAPTCGRKTKLENIQLIYDKLINHDLENTAGDQDFAVANSSIGGSIVNFWGKYWKKICKVIV